MPKKNQLGTPEPDKKEKGISPERKIEILGVILILIGLISVLAVLSNRESDYQLVTSLSFFDLFKAEHTAQIHNWLGVFGSVLSHHLVYSYLGYPVLIQSLMLFVWGWVMLRHHGLSKPTYFTVYALVFNLILSTLFGFTAILTDSSVADNAWSGVIGIFLASMTHAILGGIGGMLVLISALFITLVLVIDLDLKATSQRLQNLVSAWSDSLKDRLSGKTENSGVQESGLHTEESKPSADAIPVPPPAEREVIIQPPVQVQEPAPVLQPQNPPQATVVSRPQKPIGIPIDEILPREIRQPVSPLPVQEAPPVKPKEVILDVSEFKGSDEDFVPVSRPPHLEKPQTASHSQPAESQEPVSGRAESQMADSGGSPELKANEPSGEKSDPSKPSFFGELKRKMEQAAAQPAQNATESDSGSFQVSEPDFPDLTEIPDEPDGVTAEPEAGIETFSGESASQFNMDEEAKTEPVKIHFHPEEEPNTEPGEQDIELKINPVIEEKKANVPKDPIFRFGYRKPAVDLLQQNHKTVTDIIDPQELEENARKLVHKLGTYGIQVEGKPEVTVGPRVTLFEIKPAEGIKVSRITSLSDDIALAMAARGIRIMAPVPGKSVVGVEIPNKKSVNVMLREILESDKFQKATENGYTLPVAFGRTINNGIYIEDLAKLPHLLIAGTTGSGKSVGINTIIVSLIYHSHPANLKFVMIDPKKIELSIYKRLEKHFLAVLPELEEPILTDTSKAVTLLRAVEREMDERYTLLAKVGVRHLKDFNRKVENGEIQGPEGDPYVKLPFIVVIIDELADLMMTSGKEVEEPIARLAQLARAVGIHLVVATQRPSVDVITGIIKANFPARIAYMVTSKIDSRTILDMNGADQLLGNGDMLYLPSGSPKPERIQNAFVSTEECEAIISHVSRQPGFISAYRLPYPPDKQANGKNKKAAGMIDSGSVDEWDDMLSEAAQVVVMAQQGSTSLLQRKLKIGYGRAARIIDQLEMLGIVGPPDGSKARQVVIDDMDTLNDILNTM